MTESIPSPSLPSHPVIPPTVSAVSHVDSKGALDLETLVTELRVAALQHADTDEGPQGPPQALSDSSPIELYRLLLKQAEASNEVTDGPPPLTCKAIAVVAAVAFQAVRQLCQSGLISAGN